MKDMREHLEKLRVELAECELIRDLTTDPQKKELFTRLVGHLKVLIADIERVVTDIERVLAEKSA